MTTRLWNTTNFAAMKAMQRQRRWEESEALRIAAEMEIDAYNDIYDDLPAY